MLGSAFNPPHVGHLVLAQEAAAQLGLSRVLLVPTGLAPHKEIAGDPGAAVRLELARAAADGDELLHVAPLEIERSASDGGTSYTADTLETLERESDQELVWIMGADAALKLESWHRPERVVELARVAIARRDGVEPSEVEAVLERLDGVRGVTWIEMPQIGVSSSLVRDRVAAGGPIRYLVPDRVAELIAERELYA